jgi:hypothetical protein
MGIDGQAPKPLSQEVHKLLLQHPVDERVLCNTPGVIAEGESTGVGDPGGSVGGNCNVEWTASVILVKTHGLMRIPAYEYIDAVVGKARDPDVTAGI